MVAQKLMAVEVDWRREKETLLREIKRLRSEVGLMTRRCNNSRKEVHDMVKRLRTQPPPPIPQRPADIQDKKREGGGNVGMNDMKNEVKGQEEQEKKSVPMPEPTLDSVPKLEPKPEPTPTPKHEPEHHHSPPRHSPPVQSPTHAPLALEKQEERYRLSEEKMAEFGAVIADGGGAAAAVDTCAERWMLVWIKFCMHLAEDGKDGEAIYGEYRGGQEWDDQVIKWWNGRKDDLRNRNENEMKFDENDMSELINVAEVDRIDRICWKMKFVKGFHINLEGNDIVLRVEEL